MKGFIHEGMPNPPGRLVYEGPEVRDGRLYLSFLVPSKSRKSRRVYAILVDVETMEADCRCEWGMGRRCSETGKQTYGPVDMLGPTEGFCRHLYAVSRWVRRHRSAEVDKVRQALREYYAMEAQVA